MRVNKRNIKLMISSTKLAIEKSRNQIEIKHLRGYLKKLIIARVLINKGKTNFEVNYNCNDFPY